MPVFHRKCLFLLLALLLTGGLFWFSFSSGALNAPPVKQAISRQTYTTSQGRYTVFRGPDGSQKILYQSTCTD